jgi:phenylalanyl-tRNA synthetase beta chain
MPTVPIRKDLLFKRIGKEFTEEEFDDFTFDFGLEIDDKVRLSEIEESSSGNTEEEDVRVRDFVVIDTL